MPHRRVVVQPGRPVRDAGPPPPARSPQFGAFGCLALLLVTASAAILGAAGLFNAWIAGGIIAVAGGTWLAIYLMRRNVSP